MGHFKHSTLATCTVELKSVTGENDVLEKKRTVPHDGTAPSIQPSICLRTGGQYALFCQLTPVTKRQVGIVIRGGEAIATAGASSAKSLQ